MSKDKQWDIDRAAKALLNSGKLPKHERKGPTKKDLGHEFVMWTDRKGKPTIREVK